MLVAPGLKAARYFAIVFNFIEW